MNKLFKSFFYALITGMLLINTGCATLLNNHKGAIVLYNAPTDLVIKDNGNPVEIEQVMSSAKSRTNYSGTLTKTTTYYTSGVKLTKKEKHVLEFTSEGKTVSMNIKSKMAGGWFFLNLFTTGPLGIIIDASTHRWRKLKPSHIDVPALLSGTKQKNAHRLKKDLRKSLNKNK